MSYRVQNQLNNHAVFMCQTPESENSNEPHPWEAALRQAIHAIPASIKTGEILRIISDARRSTVCILCLPETVTPQALRLNLAYILKALPDPKMRLKYKATTLRSLLCQSCFVRYNVEDRCAEETASINAKEQEKRNQDAQRQWDKRWKAFREGYGTPANDFYLIREIITPEERTELRTMPYKEFLQTRFWKVMRRYVLWKYNNTCFLCSAHTFLNVHHRTYEYRGHEDIYWKECLVVLCHTCHGRHHEKLVATNQE